MLNKRLDLLPPASGPAFITGGSSGIGLAVAHQVVRRGQPVALFARNAERLESARAHLSKISAGQIKVFCAQVNVSDSDALARSLQNAEAELGPPTYAIASAGIAEPGLFLEQPLSSHALQMQSNYFGTLNFLHHLAPPMVANGGGRMALISSGAAFVGVYGYGAYAPAKFAVRGLAEVLRLELAEAGISITLCYPPDTDTPQLVAENRTKPAATKVISAQGGLWQPDAVARRLLHGMDRGRFIVAPGAQMAALNTLGSLIAPLLRRYQRRIINKANSRK